MASKALPRVYFHEILRRNLAALYSAPSEHARDAALLDAFSVEEAATLHVHLAWSAARSVVGVGTQDVDLLAELHSAGGAALMAAAAGVAAARPGAPEAPLSSVALQLLLHRILSRAVAAAQLDAGALHAALQAVLFTPGAAPGALSVDAPLVATLHALFTDTFAWYTRVATSGPCQHQEDAVRAAVCLLQLLLSAGAPVAAFIEAWAGAEASHGFPVFGWLITLLQACVAAPPVGGSANGSSSTRSGRPVLPLKSLVQALASYLEVLYATSCEGPPPALPPAAALALDVCAVPASERGVRKNAEPAAAASTLAWRRWVAWVADALFRSQLVPLEPAAPVASSSSSSEGSSSSSDDDDEHPPRPATRVWHTLATDVCAVLLACDPNLKAGYSGRVGLHAELEGDADGSCYWLVRLWHCLEGSAVPGCAASCDCAPAATTAALAQLPQPLAAASRVRHRDIVASSAARFLRLLLRGFCLSHPLHLECVAASLASAHFPLLALHYLQGGEVLDFLQYRDGSAPTSGGLAAAVSGAAAAAADALEAQAMAEAEAARAATARAASGAEDDAAGGGGSSSEAKISWIGSKKGTMLQDGSVGASEGESSGEGGGGDGTPKTPGSKQSRGGAAFVIDMKGTNSSGSGGSQDSGSSGVIGAHTRAVLGVRRGSTSEPAPLLSARTGAADDGAAETAGTAVAVPRLRGAPVSHRFYASVAGRWDLGSLPLPRADGSSSAEPASAPPSLVVPSTARSGDGSGTPSSLPSLGLATPGSVRTSLPRLRRALSDGGGAGSSIAAVASGSGMGLGSSLQEELLFAGGGAGRSPSFTARPTMDLELVPTDSSGLATDARKGGGGGKGMGGFSLGAPAEPAAAPSGGPDAPAAPVASAARGAASLSVSFPRGGRGAGARWAGTGTLTGAVSIASGVEAAAGSGHGEAPREEGSDAAAAAAAHMRAREATVAFACAAFVAPGPASVTAVGAGLALTQGQAAPAPVPAAGEPPCLRLPRFGVPSVPGLDAPETAAAADHRGRCVPLAVVVSPASGEALSYRRVRLLLELLQCLHGVTKTSTARTVALVRQRAGLAMISLYATVADVPPLAYWVLKLVKIQTRHLGFWKRRNMDTVSAIRRLVPTRVTDPWMEAPEGLGGASTTTVTSAAAASSGGSGGADNEPAAPSEATSYATKAAVLRAASKHEGVTRLNVDGVAGLGRGAMGEAGDAPSGEAAATAAAGDAAPVTPAAGSADAAPGAATTAPLDTTPRPRGTPLSLAARRGRGRGGRGGPMAGAGVGPLSRAGGAAATGARVSSSLLNPSSTPAAGLGQSLSFSRAAFAGPKAPAQASLALFNRLPSVLRGWEASYLAYGAPLPRAAESGRPLAAAPDTAPASLREASSEELDAHIARYAASVLASSAAGLDAATSVGAGADVEPLGCADACPPPCGLDPTLLQEWVDLALG